MDIQGALTHKIGPAPVWVYVAGASAAVFLLSRKKSSGGSGANTATPDPNAPGNQAGQFSSSISSNDPATGKSVQFTANGPNSSIYSPALLTQLASPMGYSDGPTYINLPGQSTAPAAPAPSGPQYPPVHATPAPVGATGSWWFTLPTAVPAGKLAATLYGMGPNEINNPSPGFTQILAADLVNIMAANPQINWSQLTANPNNAIPAGTAIYVPKAGGNAGVVAKPPPGASLDAPSYYQGPGQQTTMTAAA